MRWVGAISLVFASVGWLPMPGRAADIAWRTPISGVFQNPGRWNPNQVPGVADRAIFAQAATYTVSFNGMVANQQALVSQGDVTWSLSGNNYTLSGNAGALFALGLDVAGSATPTNLRVRGGELATVGARVDALAALFIEQGASLSVSEQSLVVGDFGAGELHVQDGGTLTSSVATLGFEETASAVVSVSGANAAWNNTSGAADAPLRVGFAGAATLTVEGGGRATTGQLIVADLVTSNSLVTLSGSGSSIVAEDCVFVGYEGQGALQINAGATLTSTCGELGSMVGSQGLVTLSDSATRWDITGALNVGLAGAGTLSIDSGSRMTSQIAFLGTEATGNGQALLSGSGSRWDLSEQLQVGQSGIGALTVSGGAVLTSLKAASASGSSGILGSYGVGQGTATISGAGSTWSGDGILQVGFNGHGELTVTEGGIVAHQAVALARNSGSLGAATVSGAGSKLMATTSLAVGGSSAASGGIGTMSVDSGAVVEAGSEVTIWTAGQLQLSGGAVQSPVVRVAGGKLLGAGTLSGDLINSGLVSIQGNGGSLSVAADYEQSPAATLEIVVAPSGAGGLEVVGAAHWAGAFRVTTSAGYTPQPGSVFSAATFASGSGSFQSVQTTFGNEAQQFFQVLGGTQSLSLYAPLIGDANFDGQVSGADYTIWSDYFGMLGGWAQGDFNGDGLVSGGDYTLWADHFGETADLHPASASVVVPEPGASWLLGTGCLTAAALGAARRRRAQPARSSTSRAPVRRRPAAARR